MRPNRTPYPQTMARGKTAALGLDAATTAPPSAAGIPLAIVCGYGVLFGRIRRSALRQGESRRHAALYALFCVLAKFPHCVGAVRYWIARVRGRASELIEYKVVEGGK